ncbi:MAG TPA: hypothetical protein VFT45_24155 [Longimicrobium sp.]|nr:hypothetical protein [Longimicrobium sp.]
MKFSMMALAAGAALLCAAPAHAQDQWMQQVHAQLGTVVQALNKEGLTPAGEPRVGALNEGVSDEVELQLTAGSYLIVGVCDTDCSDMDLLLSQNGTELASDFEMDDTPVLAVQVPAGGTFSLRVDMATCTAGPCRYGVGVFTTQE